LRRDFAKTRILEGTVLAGSSAVEVCCSAADSLGHPGSQSLRQAPV
jgi:hypothetical protein